MSGVGPTQVQLNSLISVIKGHVLAHFSFTRGFLPREHQTTYDALDAMGGSAWPDFRPRLVHGHKAASILYEFFISSSETHRYMKRHLELPSACGVATAGMIDSCGISEESVKNYITSNHDMVMKSCQTQRIFIPHLIG